jgi:hypothetical protein
MSFLRPLKGIVVTCLDTVVFRVVNILIVAASLYAAVPSSHTSACAWCDYSFGVGWECTTSSAGGGIGGASCSANGASCTLSGDPCIS